MHAPPKGWSRIAPAVFYDDAAKAIDWLCASFQFTPALVVKDNDGRVVHSQLMFGDGMIMVGQTGSPGKAHVQSPRSINGVNTQSLCVVVDDVDAHCQHARDAGADILMEPATQDYGEGYWIDRTYEARDLEGHRWWFLQRLDART
ncbi:MAG: VOC family protein [Pirellulaceae bacterium]|nr:VOC family protein [Planctomycetales bacterium]